MDAERIKGLCRWPFENSLEEISGDGASGLIRALQEMQEGWLGRDLSSGGQVTQIPGLAAP